MYRVRIQGEFCAAHAITIRGQREPVHGHNWRVTLTAAGPELDADGLLVDFHALQGALLTVLKSMDTKDLNTMEPFRRVNPTAEHVARHIHDEMRRGARIPNAVRIESVEVTESPGCSAVYAPSGGSESR
ncbi:MAG: 6-carboxytetrahydropterin synthase [Phycisphaerae bacterium]|nr:6-carboxytetrahydropterin synthase [Phycisphaerae bacterium]